MELKYLSAISGMLLIFSVEGSSSRPQIPGASVAVEGNGIPTAPVTDSVEGEQAKKSTTGGE
ncbi:MAG: hypothetical protein K6C34_02885 [Alphaproteobacteria bacterium]|nr:hypothetical protein [Alphaproteobacteria bacterium]